MSRLLATTLLISSIIGSLVVGCGGDDSDSGDKKGSDKGKGTVSLKLKKAN